MSIDTRLEYDTIAPEMGPEVAPVDEQAHPTTTFELQPYQATPTRQIGKGEIPQGASPNLATVVGTVAEAGVRNQDFINLRASVEYLFDKSLADLDTLAAENEQSLTEWHTIAATLKTALDNLIRNQLQTDVELGRIKAEIPVREAALASATETRSDAIEQRNTVEKASMDLDNRDHANSSAYLAFVAPFWPEQAEGESPEAFEEKCAAAMDAYLDANPERRKHKDALDSERREIIAEQQRIHAEYSDAGLQVADANELLATCEQELESATRALTALENRKTTEDEAAAVLREELKSLMGASRALTDTFTRSGVVSRLENEEYDRIIKRLEATAQKFARVNPPQFGNRVGAGGPEAAPAVAPTPRVLETLQIFRRVPELTGTISRLQVAARSVVEQHGQNLSNGKHDYMKRAAAQAVAITGRILPGLKSLGEEVLQADDAHLTQLGTIERRALVHTAELQALAAAQARFDETAQKLVIAYREEKQHDAFVQVVEHIAQAVHGRYERTRVAALQDAATTHEEWRAHHISEATSSYGHGSVYDTELAPEKRPFPGVNEYLLPKAEIERFIERYQSSDPYVMYAKRRLMEPEAFEELSDIQRVWEQQQGKQRTTIMDLYNESRQLAPQFAAEATQLEAVQTDNHAKLEAQKRQTMAAEDALEAATATLRRIENYMDEKLMPRHAVLRADLERCMAEYDVIRVEVGAMLSLDPMRVGRPQSVEHTKAQADAATEVLRTADEDFILPTHTPRPVPASSPARHSRMPQLLRRALGWVGATGAAATIAISPRAAIEKGNKE